MRCGLFSRFLLMISLLVQGELAFSKNVFEPLGTPPPDVNNDLVADPNRVLDTKVKIDQENKTYRLLDQQEKSTTTGNENNFSIQTTFSIGKDRAQQMVNLLKDAELQQGLAKVNDKGKTILKDNPELQSPAAIVAGTVALWVGKTINLFKIDSLKFAGQIEGRSKAAGFAIESPLMNGKLNYKESDGVDLKVNRSISSIQSSAEMSYNIHSQAMSTQVRHHLVPHIDLTFGKTQSPLQPQPDERAGLEYNINF